MKGRILSFELQRRAKLSDEVLMVEVAMRNLQAGNHLFLCTMLNLKDAGILHVQTEDRTKLGLDAFFNKVTEN